MASTSRVRSRSSRAVARWSRTWTQSSPLSEAARTASSRCGRGSRGSVTRCKTRRSDASIVGWLEEARRAECGELRGPRAGLDVVGDPAAGQWAEEDTVAEVRRCDNQVREAWGLTDDRIAVWRGRPQSCPHSFHGERPRPGQMLECRLGQRSHPGQRRPRVVVSILLGCAENDLPIRLGDEIALARPDNVTGGPVQGPEHQDLTFDRTDRQAQRQAAGEVPAPDARGENKCRRLQKPARSVDADYPITPRLEGNRPFTLPEAGPALDAGHGQRLDKARAPDLPLVRQPEPTCEEASGRASEERLPLAKPVRFEPLRPQTASALPAQAPLELGPVGLVKGDAQDPGRAVLHVQSSFFEERSGERRVLGTAEKREVKERIIEGRLDLRREHTGGNAGGTRGQGIALDQENAHPGPREIIGGRGADRKS